MPPRSRAATFIAGDGRLVMASSTDQCGRPGWGFSPAIDGYRPRTWCGVAVVHCGVSFDWCQARRYEPHFVTCARLAGILDQFPDRDRDRLVAGMVADVLQDAGLGDSAAWRFYAGR